MACFIQCTAPVALRGVLSCSDNIRRCESRTLTPEEFSERFSKLYDKELYVSCRMIPVKGTDFFKFSF